MPPVQMVREGRASSHSGLGHLIFPLIKNSVACPGERVEGSQWGEGGFFLSVPGASGFLWLLPLGPLALFLELCKEAIWEVRMKRAQTRTSFLSSD